MRRCSPVPIALLLAASACGPGRTVRPEVTIAAAANLTEVLQRLGPRFEAQTGIHPVFSFASTAQLAQQIENQAPFDVLAAADAVHVDALDRQGLLVPGSRAVYATGLLALWIPPRTNAAIGRIEVLASPEVRVIAVAKPELAPYGQASIDALKHAGIWDKVQPKIVYAENISMAKQYGMSGNADAVFTAYSLVLHESGKVIQVDERLYQPIVQKLGIIARSHHQEAARKFVEFLLGAAGREVLRDYGYR
jgi:molybdate transport system substrate-binding protein